MVTLVKHEWHQVDSQFAYELDMDTLAQIYPDMKKRELKALMKQIEKGEYDIDDLLNDAYDNDVEIEWERQYYDWWTDRKGGYDVTYELGNEDSWHNESPPTEPTHKCTKCKWIGQRYQTITQHLREDGTVIEDYYSSEEISTSTKDVCPMCDSELKLTEEGIKEEQERLEREAQWAKWEADNLEVNDDNEQEVVDAIAELETAFAELDKAIEIEKKVKKVKKTKK